MLTILCSLLGILSIILSYIVIQGNCPNDKVGFFLLFSGLSILSSLDYTIFSILFTFLSLWFTIYNNHKRYSIMCEQHRFLHDSYIQVAQKTREVKNPFIEEDKLIKLYTSLEKEFVDIKVRGVEPHSKHFDKAHKIQEKRENEGSPISFIKNDSPSATNTSTEKKNRLLRLWQCVKSCFIKGNNCNPD
ncbi:MAG: hypothetical protein LBH19_06870 [Dysgonamonadaceae bacterium]|jgi:hypothetical protein|nr:hypothetical protein [Dysgonamonadaceae bacterium]